MSRNKTKRSPQTKGLSLTTPLSPKEHPSLAIMESLWMQGKRAKEIAEFLSSEGLPPVKLSALAKYGQRRWSGKAKITVEDQDVANLQELISEVQASGMSVSKVALTKRTGWGWEKQDGVNTQVPRDTVASSIEIVPGSEVSLSQARLPSITIVSKASTSPSKRPAGIGLGVSIPDGQLGYHRSAYGTITTTHDEACINVQNQIMAYLQATEGVDLVIWQGDNADFAEFSVHRTAPGYLHNTQLTIDRCGALVATQRALTPDAKLVWIEGNHEARLTKMLTDKMPALVGLTRSADSEPVMSVPYLCRFDEYDVEYRGAYPTGEYWANDGLRFEHGNAISSVKGATAPKYLKQGVSTVYGHSHGAEMVWSRRTERDQSWDIFAGSAGCSCRIDGTVPSTKSGILDTGDQSQKKGIESWHQGMMIIYYELEGKRAWPQIITIDNGYAVFRGQEFRSTVDVNGIELEV